MQMDSALIVEVANTQIFFQIQVMFWRKALVNNTFKDFCSSMYISS